MKYIIVIIILFYFIYRNTTLESFQPVLIPLDYSLQTKLQECCATDKECYSKPPFKQKNKCTESNRTLLNQYNLLDTSHILQNQTTNKIDIEEKFGSSIFNNMLNDERDIATGFDIDRNNINSSDNIIDNKLIATSIIYPDKNSSIYNNVVVIKPSDINTINYSLLTIVRPINNIHLPSILLNQNQRLDDLLKNNEIRRISSSGNIINNIDIDNTSFLTLKSNIKTNLNNNLGTASELNNNLDKSGSNINNSSLNPGTELNRFDINTNSNINNVNVYLSSEIGSTNNDYMIRANNAKLKPESYIHDIRFGSNIYNYASNPSSNTTTSSSSSNLSKKINSTNKLSKLQKTTTKESNRISFDKSVYNFDIGEEQGYLGYNYIKKVI
jgi:hypothetical protein